MKYLLLSLVMLMMTSLSVMAQGATTQETPKTEYSAGYNYLRMADQNYNGFNTSMTYNLNKSVGIVSDFNKFYAQDNIFGISTPNLLSPGQTAVRGSAPESIYTLMFGPRLSLNKNGRITPFAETLIGLDHIDERFQTVAGTTKGDAILNDRHNSFASFASKIGGGLDINATRHITFKALEADYLFLNNVKNGSGIDSQNGLQLSSGVTFHF